MIKRTIYFGSPAYLSKQKNQLKIDKPDKEKDRDQNNNDKYIERITSEPDVIPIEDIGIIILDNPQITITQSLIAALLENNCAIITCDSRHMPKGMFLNLEQNIIQTENFHYQIDASLPLKKNLWRQTISAKIFNQAMVLAKRHKPCENLKKWAKEVKSGDPDNLEARAANYYWKNLFFEDLNFSRDSEGEPPNNLLNYGYAILRATVARGLVASGLLPAFGIHHKSKYNAFCLADDIMEPYRPFVDDIVATIIENGEDFTELNPSIKEQLLKIPAIDIFIDGEKRPLMIGLQRTTSSLVKCFKGEQRKINYPVFKYEIK